MEITSYLLGKKQGGGGSEPTGTINITSNGSHNVKSYATANVNVPTGITPTGTINITENGTSDVTNYASASVNVQPDLETKSITITENTTTTITPTQGKDGLSSVEVTTNVSGGGETIDTLTKLNAKANEFVNYLLQIPNSYSASTTENVTLYTPDANFKSYMIVKRSDGKYRGYWLETGSGGSYDGGSGIYNFAIVNNTNNTQSIAKWNNSLITGSFYFSALYRTPNDYYSLQDCLNALKSSSTSYYKNTATLINISKESTFDIPFSNTFAYDTSIDEILTTQKISSNETIEVIPTT